MLKNAGFHDVIAEDRTDQVSLSNFSTVFDSSTKVFYYANQFTIPIFQFLGVLRRELAEFEKNKDNFLSDFTQVVQQLP
jgi:phosphoethanolamine N-methyltransferase